MPEITRETILDTVRQVVAANGQQVSFAEFQRISGISEYYVYKEFPEGGWSEVRRLIGLDRHPMDKVPLSDDDLMTEFHSVVTALDRIPTWAIFDSRANKKISSSALRRRFGGRSSLLRRYRKWLRLHHPGSPLLTKLQGKSWRETPPLSSTSRKRKSSKRKTEVVSSFPLVIDLRNHLAKIKNPDTHVFVEETVKCLEADLYRAAVVMSWTGAVSVLYDYVLAHKLADFNAEAKRRDSRWKIAVTKDDLALMKESDFLDILVAISVMGKNVKEHLKNNCLNLRNACGHPSSLKLSKHIVESHIEALLLNVYEKY